MGKHKVPSTTNFIARLIEMGRELGFESIQQDKFINDFFEADLVFKTAEGTPPIIVFEVETKDAPSLFKNVCKTFGSALTQKPYQFFLLILNKKMSKGNRAALNREINSYNFHLFDDVLEHQDETISEITRIIRNLKLIKNPADYFFPFVQAETEVKEDGTMVHRLEYNIKITAGDYPSFSRQTIYYNPKRQECPSAKLVDANVKNSKAEFKIGICESTVLHYRVEFSPPLTGEGVWLLEEEWPKHFYMNKKDIVKEVKGKRWPFPEPCEGKGFSILYRTDRLRHTVMFPPRFKICNSEYAKVSSLGNPWETITKLTKELYNKKYVRREGNNIIMDILNPVLGMIYWITWYPPDTYLSSKQA